MMNIATLSQVSLQSPASFPELYYPLWWYSGSYASGGTGNTSAGTVFAQKGNVNGTTSGTISSVKLFVNNFPSSTKFALEASLNNNANSTCDAELWDVTSNTAVSSSQISYTGTTFTVVRSNQFTLTQGHTYALTFWNPNNVSPFITDASLIVFPPSPSVSPSLSSISLVDGSSLKEAYIPLWVYSSGTTSVNGAATYYLAQKGNTTPTASSSITSASKLYTLTSNWSASQKFAFECSLYSSAGTLTANATLYDLTSGTATQVNGSNVTTTSTTATLIRSGQFTLTPGHTYGVGIYLSGGTVYLTKAHLVALSS